MSALSPLFLREPLRLAVNEKWDIDVKQFISQVRRLVKLGITKRDPAEVGTYGHIWLSHFANITLNCISWQFTPEEQSRFARLDIDPGEPNAPPACFSAIFHPFSAVFRRAFLALSKTSKAVVQVSLKWRRPGDEWPEMISFRNKFNGSVGQRPSPGIA